MQRLQVQAKGWLDSIVGRTPVNALGLYACSNTGREKERKVAACCTGTVNSPPVVPLPGMEKTREFPTGRVKWWKAVELAAILAHAKRSVMWHGVQAARVGGVPCRGQLDKDELMSGTWALARSLSSNKATQRHEHLELTFAHLLYSGP